jgi:hypothetical protein
MAQVIVNRITTISLDLNAELPTFAISANISAMQVQAMMYVPFVAPICKRLTWQLGTFGRV